MLRTLCVGAIIAGCSTGADRRQSLSRPVPMFAGLTREAVQDLCSGFPGPALPDPGNAQEAAARLTGTWLLCSTTGVYPFGDVGIRIDASGEVLSLRWNSDGLLVGEPTTATVDVLPNYPIQANFEIPGGFVPTHPVITQSPRHFVTLLMMGGYADYVDAETDPSTVPRPQPVCAIGAPTPIQVQQACGTPAGGRVTYATVDEFKSAMTGFWYRCSAGAVVPRAHDGVAIGTASYNLIEFRNEVPYRRGDLWGTGTTEFIDTSIMNGPGVYQINFNMGGGGTFMFQPHVEYAPTAFSASSPGMADMRYVKLPCNP